MKVRHSRLALIAGASLVTLSLAGCCSSKSSASGAVKPAGNATTTSMKMDHSGGSHDTTSPTGSGAHDMAGHGDVLTGTATGDSPCEKSSPKPASPGQVNQSGAAGTDAEGGHGGRGMLKQLPVTHADRVLLSKQMIQARAVIDRYPTVKSAEAAGYKESTVFVPCIGAHYTNLKYLAFDPSNPSELLFDGTDPNSKIIGLSYLVFSPGGQPEGFAGPNDHFHQHNANGGLCLKDGLGVVGGEDVSVAECTKRGGKKGGKIMENVWMAHAWVAPGWECTWGVFAGECPELGGRLGGTAFDAPAPQK